MLVLHQVPLVGGRFGLCFASSVKPVLPGSKGAWAFVSGAAFYIFLYSGQTCGEMFLFPYCQGGGFTSLETIRHQLGSITFSILRAMSCGAGPGCRATFGLKPVSITSILRGVSVAVRTLGQVLPGIARDCRDCQDLPGLEKSGAKSFCFSSSAVPNINRELELEVPNGMERCVTPTISTAAQHQGHSNRVRPTPARCHPVQADGAFLGQVQPTPLLEQRCAASP